MEETLEWLEELSIALEILLAMELMAELTTPPLLVWSVFSDLVLQPHRAAVNKIALDRAMVLIIFFIKKLLSGHCGGIL